MNRITFFDSISGIDYPEMLVNFYDQFLALKELSFGFSSISVIGAAENSITFHIVFAKTRYKDNALSTIYKCNSRIFIYSKYIPINVDSLTDTELTITLLK